MNPPGLFPAGTRRGRAVRALRELLRAAHPEVRHRSDLGDVIAAWSGTYPYERWLRRQQRRRKRSESAGGSDAGSEVVSAVSPVGPLRTGSDAPWPGPPHSGESDALGLVAAAINGGAEAVQWHDDIGSGSADRRIRIIPRLGPVALHRADPASTAFAVREDLLETDQASLATAPGRRIALQTVNLNRVVHLDEVLVHLREDPGTFREPESVTRPSPSDDPVAVVIPSPGNRQLLQVVFSGLVSEPAVSEVVVVDNSAPDPGLDEFYEGWTERIPLVVQRTDPSVPFNYSRANNTGASLTSAPVLAFLNDDLEFLQPDSLGRLAGWLTAEGVGVVGPQLRYPDGSIQHGGVVIGLNGLAEHAFTGMAPGSDTHIGNVDSPRDVSAVTGACLLTTREVFDSVGGFDTELVLTGSDVWFCLEAGRLGWGTAYEGGVALVHHESVARGDTNHLDDVLRSARRWGHLIDEGDRYWSKRLAIHLHEPTLRHHRDPTSREMLESYLRRRGVSEEVVQDLGRGSDEA